MDMLTMWLRLERRRRWRSLLVLALLVMIACGTVLTAAAGARRGASALDRLLDETHPATAVVSPFQPGFDWAAVRALPEVAALTTYPYYSDFTIDEIPGYPYDPPYVPADAEAMRTIEAPVVLAGRPADPARADEAVVTADFAGDTGLGVGAIVTMRLYTPEQLTEGLLGRKAGAPGGPAVPVRIVGVVRSPWLSDQAVGTGVLVPSAGLLARYRANFLGADEEAPLNALVRLRNGDADLAAFSAGLARVSGRPDIDVLARSGSVAHVQDVLRFESTSLFAFALAALVASVVLVGQSVVRVVAASAADRGVLRALGMSRGREAVLATAGPLLAAAAGAVAGVAAAVVASAWMPFGTAARFEPAPGMDVDLLVLGVGILAAPALVVAVAAAVVRWAPADPARPRRSALADAALRVGLPVPVVIGTRFALDPGRGRDAVQVRLALLAAVTGVLGIAAACTFAAGVADAAEHPERFGQTHQLVAVFGFGGQDIGPTAPMLGALAADPAVVAVDDLRVAAAESGPTSVPTFTLDPGLPVVILDGSAPRADGEVVLAPASARRLGAGVGSTVPFTGDGGSAALHVTGIGFVLDSLYNDYDTGAWVTSGGYDRLFTGFKQHGALLVLRPGTDPGAAIPRLQQAAETAGGVPGVLVFPPDTPQQLGEIQNVRVLPVVLGGFLVVLAIGASGHAVAATARRRRPDFAVLRAVGMTRGQARAVVITQASVLAVVGLLFGIPLGLALGRTLWRLVADITPLQYQAPDALVAVLLVVPLALLTATALAAWPGRQAARLRIGHVLRAE